MKQILFITSLVCFVLVPSCTPQQDSIEAETFKVTVTNFYFGRTDAVTTLTQDSLIARWGVMNNDIKTLARKLNIEEKVRVKRFMNKFPIKTLKDQYVNEAVEDGTQMQFDFYIGNTSKRIFVANKYVEDLGKLVELLDSLLPVDFIMYNRNSVPWE